LRKYSLELLKAERRNILRGGDTVYVPNGHNISLFSDTLRAYFVAFGDKVKIVEVGKDELYVKLEKI